VSSSVNSAANSSALANAAAAGAASSASNPLLSLTDNFQSFLQMLMTQLQNQDPTSPMDSNTFTTELVQFAGVEQQISTNGDLTQLIQLTQGNTVVQSSELVGKQVQVNSSQLTLQGGTAAIDYTAPAAEPVTITVSNSSGQALYQATVASVSGANGWSWNGQTSDGTTARDGAYTVNVQGSAAGSTSALPFTVVGTVTGVTDSNSVVNINLGGLTVNMSDLTSLGS
jgi:flagellar basal-body rod modification protein FlgD